MVYPLQVANEKGYEYAAPPEATEDNRIMGLQGNHVCTMYDTH